MSERCQRCNVAISPPYEYYCQYCARTQLARVDRELAELREESERAKVQPWQIIIGTIVFAWPLAVWIVLQKAIKAMQEGD